MNNKLILAICTLVMCFGCFQDQGNLYTTSAGQTHTFLIKKLNKKA